MPRKPSTHRKDRNHDRIVEIAESHGWDCVSLSSAGSGVPDLLCWRHPDGFMLVEVKAPKGGRLTDAQKKFRERHRMPVWYPSTEASAHVVFSKRRCVGEE